MIRYPIRIPNGKRGRCGTGATTGHQNTHAGPVGGHDDGVEHKQGDHGRRDDADRTEPPRSAQRRVAIVRDAEEKERGNCQRDQEELHHMHGRQIARPERTYRPVEGDPEHEEAADEGGALAPG